MTLVTERPPVHGVTPRAKPMQAVFLDRDGVINANRPDHVKSWSEFEFLPGAPEAIARLTRAGVRVFVVSNQAIVNRGMVPGAAVDEVNAAMVREVGRHGGHIEAVAYCPHRPDEECNCRKPRPGLLLSLARRFGLDLASCVMVGDAVTDLMAGLAVGARAILVLTGRGREQLPAAIAGGTDFAVAADLATATDLLLGSPARAAFA